MVRKELYFLIYRSTNLRSTNIRIAYINPYQKKSILLNNNILFKAIKYIDQPINPMYMLFAL